MFHIHDVSQNALILTTRSNTRHAITTSFKIAEPPDCVLYPRRNMSFGDKISWSNIANYLNFLPKKHFFQ